MRNATKEYLIMTNYIKPVLKGIKPIGMLHEIIVWRNLVQFASPRYYKLRRLSFIIKCCNSYHKMRRFHLIQNTADNYKMLQPLLENRKVLQNAAERLFINSQNLYSLLFIRDKSQRRIIILNDVSMALYRFQIRIK